MTPFLPSRLSRLFRPSRQRQRQQYSSGLGLGLVPFGQGVGVSDDAGAGLNPGPPALHDAGADGYSGIERPAAPAYISDRAGVWAPAHRFELIDDLHGPDLG